MGRGQSAVTIPIIPTKITKSPAVPASSSIPVFGVISIVIPLPASDTR